jgi:hypothetical protein
MLFVDKKSRSNPCKSQFSECLAFARIDDKMGMQRFALTEVWKFSHQFRLFELQDDRNEANAREMRSRLSCHNRQPI